MSELKGDKLYKQWVCQSCYDKEDEYWIEKSKLSTRSLQGMATNTKIFTCPGRETTRQDIRTSGFLYPA